MTIPELFERYAPGALSGGSISAFGWLDAAGSQASRFLPEGPADFPNGHRAVLVCGHCGDFSCGALTVGIAAQADFVVWSDWMWQAEGDESQLDDYQKRVPAFRFERAPYVEVLRKALDVWSQ